MKKQLSINLLTLLFLLIVNTAFASFPVKKIVTTTVPTTTLNTSIEETVETTYVVNTSEKAAGKSQIVALLLVIFLGYLGIHRFYLGYTWQGVVQLLTLGGLGIWAFIDFIRIILGDLKPKDGEYEQTF